MYDIRHKLIIVLLLIGFVTLLGFKESEFLIYEDMEPVNEKWLHERLYSGISKVNKTLINGDNYYSLIKDEIVIIKGFRENKLIIIDKEDNEFEVDNNLIEIIRGKNHVSRGLVSRRTDSVNKVIKKAHNELGKPYVYGDVGKRGYDCSGLVYSVYSRELGIELPRTSYSLIDIGSNINKEDLVPGDILLFNTTGHKVSHAGIYIGEGNMIHASSGEGKVTISTIDSGYFNSRYVTARRVIE